MGRILRMVPPNWEHPRQECRHSPRAGGCAEAKAHGGECYHPLYDESFDEAAKEWKEGFAAWERGERPEYCSEESAKSEYWEYNGGPPDPDYYHPKWEADPTWFQVYETVSEGTPVSPPFATKQELILYLSKNGDFWEQLRAIEEKRAVIPWSVEAAENFVNDSEWAPSIVFSTEAGVQEGYEAIVDMKKKAEG
jgi:hypothetical protein